MKVMEILDRCHTKMFGNPEPVSVPTAPVPGKCILISGHDVLNVYLLLKDIERLGLDINVYTHGELLPAHAYPEIRKFSNLRGHFGDAWQRQIHDFKDFPGPIIMTSNCLMPPRRRYRGRLYTTNAVGYDDVRHVDIFNERDREEVLRHALCLQGFDEENCDKWKDQSPMVTGFGHQAMLSHAGTLLESINNGQLKHIFYIGGCDGTEDLRSYFRDLAAITPENSLILTSGCGKFRLKGLELGNLGDTGIPRILDIGQCNDAYSAVVVATKLAEALGCSIHDLPLHFAVSWFEQKAVAIFLSLMHLGVKNVRLGPALPAFLTPDLRQYLFENMGVRAINAEDEKADMEAFLRE